MSDHVLKPGHLRPVERDWERGERQGRWARENVPAELDRREGQPPRDAILSESPEWAAGYVAGGRS